MDIKWKSRITVIVGVLLFTFGFNSVMTCLDWGGYFKEDFFKTQEFESELNQFIDYLSVYELNAMTKEEAKKAITVSEDEINEHRYRYGNLPEQIANIKGQYEHKIQEAQITNNHEVANAYIAERDKKIEDISNNFKDDQYVRVKVVAEKEEKIDKYYSQLESFRLEYHRYKSAFKYYLKDTTTGAVYTNINSPEGGSKNDLDPKEMLFLRSYPSSTGSHLSTEGRGINLGDNINQVVAKKGSLFEGAIAVPKTSFTGNFLIAQYYDFQQKQRLFFIYSITGIIALLLSLYLRKKVLNELFYEMEKWRSYYNRIPLDIRLFLFAVFGLITLSFLVDTGAFYYQQSLYALIKDIVTRAIMATLLLTATLSQGKFLLYTLKEKQLKADWQKSLLTRAIQGINSAFLLRGVGTQVILLMSVVFTFGAGSIIVVLNPRLIIPYILAFLLVGLPAFLIIVKSISYFNRIVITARELANGNLEPDLPVKGKSVLAKLADNLNTLKQGVKVSQKEQAKSERLKTELITNVSHDLRTPLTSIITYTELLKTPDLEEADREAYLQIIDRKSKRLKVLIDDLFEASKMASGSVELRKEKVDLVQLLQQALAEYDETVSQSTLQFRVRKPEGPIYSIVDGQKLWRVFDNLIGNILKYSLENTRVYITMKAINDRAVITFKNVTKYELGEDLEELFERFKRGDKSRHTEGSGLGLAIAKSIIDLHDGSLDIEVDGDLFKVTVYLAKDA